jgi:hypothetical protein
MHERKRLAIDIAGQRVELVERQESTLVKTTNGGTQCLAPAEFFGPDGEQLIPEGDGFFRTTFGVRFKVVD